MASYEERTRIQITIPVDLLKRLDAHAKSASRSRSGQIEDFVRSGIDRPATTHRPPAGLDKKAAKRSAKKPGEVIVISTPTAGPRETPVARREVTPIPKGTR